MSAAARDPLDWYPTPAWCVRALCRVAEREGWWEPGDTVFDPAAGDGALLDVLREECGLITGGIEIHQARAAIARDKMHRVTDGNALEEGAWPAGRPIVVMNPPYTYAELFVSAALARRPPRGIVCALLRNSFIESRRRACLHREHPADVYGLPRRPKFMGSGTDSAGSSWWVWRGRPAGEPIRWYLLAPEDAAA